MTKHAKNGSISLTTVLIVGSMLLLSSIVLLTSSLDLLYSTKAYTDHKSAQINSSSCLEEAMAKIKSNPTFTGIANISINKGSCSYNITDYQSNPLLKSITLTGTLNGTIFSTKRLVDTTKSPMTISELN